MDTAFSQALRRHERRARRMGFANLAETLRIIRVEGGPLRDVAFLRESEALWKDVGRKVGATPGNPGRGLSRNDRKCPRSAVRSWSWLYGRAADAVARLSSAAAGEREIDHGVSPEAEIAYLYGGGPDPYATAGA